MFDAADFDALDFETGGAEAPPAIVAAYPMYYLRGRRHQGDATAERAEAEMETLEALLL
jgi:hypothetical protein